MKNQIRLAIEDSCNPADALHVLGDNIQTLAKMKTNNENEAEAIHWIVTLLAGGVSLIADTMPH